MKVFHLILLLFMALALSAQNSPLKKYQWKNRLILIFSDDKHEDLLESQLNQFKSVQEGLDERDLVIIHITEDKVISADKTHFSKSDATWLIQTYLADQETTFKLILIGKDGGRKFSKTKLTDPEEIFAIIDQMPMRRAEMRRRKQ